MPRSESERLRALALSCLACAFLTGVVALYVQHLFLPSSDEAARASFIATLIDPFVLTIWIPCLLLGAGVGFVAAVVMLRKVQLRKAVPLVTVASVIGAAVVAPVLILLSPLFGLAAALTAMEWCQHNRTWQRDPPSA